MTKVGHAKNRCQVTDHVIMDCNFIQHTMSYLCTPRDDSRAIFSWPFELRLLLSVEETVLFDLKVRGDY